ncbi:MAG: CBS domain-containing protein, partial [Desulfobacterales bacterium]|nr:CBS domain-containing protein [Desulfobacterales bacterium]
VTLLGGGGHAFAAAATIKDMTLAQTEHKLLESLYKTVKPKRLATDLMSSPPIMIGPDVTCRDANNALTRYNINALLVVEKAADKDELLGCITRQVIEKAIYHRLGDIPVKEYMSSEPATVAPDADIFEIQQKIIDSKQRILPVIDNDKLTGVITRTDLLNILVRQSQHTTANLPDPLREPIQARTRNVINFMNERLPKRILGILRDIGRVAAEIDCRAYVVGGFVRDLFLYRSNEDIDIVIEGDGIAFAKRYAKKVGARINTYKKFGTAVIIFPDGFKIDVASARMEYYKFPAALPIVEMSSIRLDLFRRDFTINTLAIQLTPDKFGILIDFFAARKDIKEKAIRVLHNLSFVEDPTRVFRAIRFEQRFGFSIGKLTSRLIKNAVKMNFFKRLRGKRVFAELRQILEEENPASAIIRLNDYGLLGVIHPEIELDKKLIELFNSAKKVLSWYDLLFIEESYKKWIVYFLVLIKSCNKKISGRICTRFEITLKLKKVFCNERFAADKCLLWLELNLPVKNSILHKQLSVFKTELILYMMAATKLKSVKKAISYYFTRLRYTDILITGNDLKAMGLESGPIYREIMQAVLDARLNGKLKTLNDEITYVKKYVSKF